MPTILVVKNAFKSRGVLFAAGQVIEDPAEVTLIRSRIGSRDVLELDVNSPMNASWLDYFSTRVKGELDPRVVEACSANLQKKKEPVKAAEPAKAAEAIKNVPKAATVKPKVVTSTVKK